MVFRIWQYNLKGGDYSFEPAIASKAMPDQKRNNLLRSNRIQVYY